MHGVWTALVTPFNQKNEIDIPAYRKLLTLQKEAGVTGVIPCGTTGEAPTLSHEEKKTLIQLTLDELKGSEVKVVAGTGTHSTQETIELSKWASDRGVDGVLVVTPYYNKPNPTGLLNHFLSVANAVSCEVILYNVPSRTGVSLHPETILELSFNPRIRTLKEATGNPTFASEILDLLYFNHSKIDLLSGDDATFLPLLAVGAVGIISVASNLFPHAMIALYQAFNEGKIQKATQIHQSYYPLFRDLFMESNPIPLKYALSELGLCENSLRNPLAPLSEKNRERLKASLKRCEL